MNTTAGPLDSPIHQCGDTLQLVWQNLCSKYPPALLEILMSATVQFTFFWIPCTLLLLLDLLFPEFSSRHKIQSERRQPTWAQIKHCIHHVFVNTISGILIQLGLAYLSNFQLCLFRVSPELPTAKEIVIDFVYAFLCREILFYYSHRLFHHPSIYRQIHK